MAVQKKKKSKEENDVLAPKSAKEWQAWLKENHTGSGGVWLQIQKKGSDEKSPTYAEALDVALCYGWIDGQKKKHDESS